MGNDNLKSFSIEDFKKINKKDLTPKEKIILLLGETGRGKSTFINQITGKNECIEGKTAEATTIKPKAVPLNFEGYNYYFIDTPGLNDKKGDDNNIKYIIQLRDVPRITCLIIVLNFNDIKITKSIQQSLILFMNIFPAKSFWDNVIVVRNWSFDDDMRGELLKGINNDEELMNCMNKNNIKKPVNIQEFYINLKSNNQKKKNMLEQIIAKIKEMNPVYKEVIIEYKDRLEKNGDFVYLIFDKITKYVDFDNKSHSFKEVIYKEPHNIKNLKPSLIIVKREVGSVKNKFLCWCKQYEVNYVCYITYEIQGKKHIESYIKETALEEEDDEEKGEEYRLKLENEVKENLNCLK